MGMGKAKANHVSIWANRASQRCSRSLTKVTVSTVETTARGAGTIAAVSGPCSATETTSLCDLSPLCYDFDQVPTGDIGGITYFDTFVADDFFFEAFLRGII